MRTPARRLMLLAVLALHAGAFHWLASSLGERRIARSAEPVPLEVIMLNEVLEEPLPLQQPPPVTRPARSAKPSPQPKAQMDDADRAAQPAESTAIHDWYSEAERAADEMLENSRRQDALRSFAHKRAPETELEKPGVFGSETRNRRAGKPESDLNHG